MRINVIRVVSYVEHEHVELSRSEITLGEQPAVYSERECHYPTVEDPVLTRVYDYNEVKEGMAVPGPALIETPNTTYLVEPEWTLTMGKQGSARMVRG